MAGKARVRTVAAKSKSVAVTVDSAPFVRPILVTVAIVVIAIVLANRRTTNATVTVLAGADLLDAPLRINVKCEEKYKGDSECVPDACGRIVIDNFASDAQVAQLSRIADKAISYGGDSSTIIFDTISGAVTRGQQFIDAYRAMQTRPNGNTFTHSDKLLLQTMTSRVRSAVAEHFNASGLQLTKPAFFSRIEGGAVAKTLNDEYWHTHVDTIAYGSFVYTSLIYLNNFGDDFEGGKFAFSDANATQLSVVQPRKGRLVMFTSGVENRHRVEKVRSGTRRAFTIAFTCTPSLGFPHYLEDRGTDVFLSE